MTLSTTSLPNDTFVKQAASLPRVTLRRMVVMTMEFSRDAEQMDSRHHYRWMLSGAQSTAEYLRESWKRPVRHNRALELAALWYTIELDLSCRGTVDTAGTLSLPVSASTANQ